jgi:hypothetical protein
MHELNHIDDEDLKNSNENYKQTTTKQQKNNRKTTNKQQV